MDQYHKPYDKKVGSGTGGRRKKTKDKKLSHIGGTFASTKVSEKDVRVKRRTRGGNSTLKLKKAVSVNVVTKDGMKKAKISKVIESHNREFVRRGIITRGAILETDVGKVKVTNRVGQDGIINGILV
jgi:small subunit ribosomal protein S8e